MLRRTGDCMRKQPFWVPARSVVLTMVFTYCVALVPSLAGQALDEKVQELTREVRQMNTIIQELRAEIAKSREETRELRLEVLKAAGQREAGKVVPISLVETSTPTGDSAIPVQSATPPVVVASQQPDERLDQLEEGQRLLESRLEEQYQTKVESSSRYRTRLSGIVMLNAFENRGRVDRTEVPNLALRTLPGDAAGTFGLTALQSQLGFEAYGPTLAGARASAGIQFDFFGASGSGDYAAWWGAARLRTATVRLDWTRTSIVVGQDEPFVSPLSPTSVASLAYPAFSYSGNLWNWIPQARVEHRFSVSELNTISVQGGFLDPSPRDADPDYAARLAWSHGEGDRPLTLGVGGYYSRQNHGSGRTEDGWAATADWAVPLGNRFELSGEFYRGRAFGSLGAAQGRSVLFSGPESDPASSLVGLNSIGGWAQLTFKATSAVELNGAYGEDQPYSRDLQTFVPPNVYNGGISRNRSGMFNIIYRPRTDLVFSLEYRRLKTWRVSTDGDRAGHLNLGVGVLF
jgi:hypothetical protein